MNEGARDADLMEKKKLEAIWRAWEGGSSIWRKIFKPWEKSGERRLARPAN